MLFWGFLITNELSTLGKKENKKQWTKNLQWLHHYKGCHQSKIPVSCSWGRQNSQWNWWLFVSIRAAQLRSLKKKNTKPKKNWVLFQRVMKQSSLLKYCLSCSPKHWFCPLTGILLHWWLIWNILGGEEACEKVPVQIYDACPSASLPGSQPPLTLWSTYLKALTATQSEKSRDIQQLCWRKVPFIWAEVMTQHLLKWS